MANIGGTLMENNNRYYPNAYYKVGDLFFTTNKENPSIRFGGLWELFGKGKTLVCVDETDTDFNEVKKTGGEKKHTLTVDEIAEHSHWGIYGGNTNVERMAGWGNTSNHTGTINEMTENAWESLYTGKAGGSQPHNNLQPYITCYIWIRIK